MDASSDILRFPDRKSRSSRSSHDDDDGVDDFESWEVHSELQESEDYPALVRYCEREVARHPGDPYANERLGTAYVLNGQYQKAIDSMGACHRKHPDIEDFQHIILDALFALGKTESDFPWVKAPAIIRLGPQVLDDCYEYLRPKRKPRSINELYTTQLLRGYIMFSHEQLMQALAADPRFIVRGAGDDYLWAEVSICRT